MHQYLNFNENFITQILINFTFFCFINYFVENTLVVKGSVRGQEEKVSWIHYLLFSPDYYIETKVNLIGKRGGCKYTICKYKGFYFKISYLNCNFKIFIYI